jgi:hypothetical protein
VCQWLVLAVSLRRTDIHIESPHSAFAENTVRFCFTLNSDIGRYDQPIAADLGSHTPDTGHLLVKNGPHFSRHRTVSAPLDLGPYFISWCIAPVCDYAAVSGAEEGNVL